jgi:hypothetical protein
VWDRDVATADDEMGSALLCFDGLKDFLGGEVMQAKASAAQKKGGRVRLVVHLAEEAGLQPVRFADCVNFDEGAADATGKSGGCCGFFSSMLTRKGKLGTVVLEVSLQERPH